MKEIDNTSIDDELNLIKGESSSAVCVRLYPYNNLDDREFEVLVWRLFTEDICSFYEEDGVEVKLMEGVCDKGRDVTFKKNGKYICVVQCKNYKNRYTYPDFLAELTKVISYYILDKKETELERYIMVAPEGCVGPVTDFLDNRFTNLDETNIKLAVEKNIKDYEHFKDLSYENIKDKLLECIKRIKIDIFTSHDLDYRLLKYPNVTKQFFELNSIIDIPSFKKMLDSYKTEIETSYITVRRMDYSPKNAISFNKFTTKMLNGERWPELENYINNTIVPQLTDATIEARGLYSMLIENSFEPLCSGAIRPYKGDTIAMFSTIQSKCSLELKTQIPTFLNELENRRKLIIQYDYDDVAHDCKIGFLNNDFEELPSLFREYCKKEKIQIDDIFVKLNFSLLD